ncbi:MAG: type II secretion system F family protein [Mogibacterium sp.]|nr:type II secretion system F family protein [Mogibacterium sp.]
MEDQLYDVGIEMPVKDFIMFWVGSMAIITLAMSLIGINLIISVPVIFIVALFPAFLIKSKKKKRCNMIEDQLLDAIQVLINALKVGYSFNQAMQNIVKEMDGPIAEEFGRVFMETQHGMNLEDSLESMCARVGSDDLSMMCMAVEIQHKVGGNLSEILTSISETIKGRLRLKADVKVKTSSGRVSGLIIGALPILLFVMFLVINPGYMQFFSSGIGGYLCVLFCVVMEAVGFVVINKIISIKY